jgi:excinuclease UvrABC nuclease subunit
MEMRFARWSEHIFSVLPYLWVAHEEIPPRTCGVYIFAGIGDAGRWVPCYIGISNDIRRRLQSHSRCLEADLAGATHVYYLETDSRLSAQCGERCLVFAQHPKLNRRLRAKYQVQLEPAALVYEKWLAEMMA